MKRLLFMSVIIVLLISCTTVSAAPAVFVNGIRLSTDARLINDRIYVPLRAVSESMGATVNWSDENYAAYIESAADDNSVINAIKTAGESVVAIVGNYKPEYMSQQALSYNESYAHGAGVIIKNNGLILTNAHVVENLENITVILANGESYGAALQCIDTKSDLATVKINKLGLKPITFGTMDSVVTGSTVIAIGTPISLSMMNSASKGIVSGKNVNIGEHYSFTQSDVAINGGNSGGALINLKGELVGINSSKFAGIGIEGMSFSIPVDTVNYVLSQFEKNGKVLRPVTNITFSESWEAKIGLPTAKGLTVKSSTNSQIKSGDMVTKINGINVHSITDYNEAVKLSKNNEVVFTVSRDGTDTNIVITPEWK
ncbi:MAG: trypsin-like peptidase domain-containing protein [Clostridia bacterium]|nr:trypsin-like peptidase domain-containing protein [Clostridia bacterium]